MELATKQKKTTGRKDRKKEAEGRLPEEKENS